MSDGLLSARRGQITYYAVVAFVLVSVGGMLFGLLHPAGSDPVSAMHYARLAANQTQLTQQITILKAQHDAAAKVEAELRAQLAANQTQLAQQSTIHKAQKDATAMIEAELRAQLAANQTQLAQQITIHKAQHNAAAKIEAELRAQLADRTAHLEMQKKRVEDDAAAKNETEKVRVEPQGTVHQKAALSKYQKAAAFLSRMARRVREEKADLAGVTEQQQESSVTERKQQASATKPSSPSQWPVGAYMWRTATSFRKPLNHSLTLLGSSASANTWAFGPRTKLYFEQSTVTNMAQGFAGSDWSSLYMDSLVPPDTDFIMWE